jgi:hypothetical protein
VGDALRYGLRWDELRYVLDPQEVYGSDFPAGDVPRVDEVPIFRLARPRHIVPERAWGNGEGDQGVRGVQDEEIGVGEVGEDGGGQRMGGR